MLMFTTSNDCEVQHLQKSSCHYSFLPKNLMFHCKSSLRKAWRPVVYRMEATKLPATPKESSHILLLQCHIFPKPALTDFFLFLLLLFALCSKAASLSSLSLSLPALTATPMAWGFWPDRAMSHSTDSNPLIPFNFSKADRSAKKDPH